VGRSVRAVRVVPVQPRCLAPPAGCWRCGGRGPGVVAALDPRRPSGTPTGIGRAGGGGAAGVLRPKGPTVLPARPSGPGRTDRDLCRLNGPTIPLDARAVRGTVGPLGRTGWWWRPPGPPTLAGRAAGPLGRTTDRSDIKGADVKGDRSLIPQVWGIAASSVWVECATGEESLSPKNPHAVGASFRLRERAVRVKTHDCCETGQVLTGQVLIERARRRARARDSVGPIEFSGIPRSSAISR